MHSIKNLTFTNFGDEYFGGREFWRRMIWWRRFGCEKTLVGEYFGGRKSFGGIPVNPGFGGNIWVPARPKGVFYQRHMLFSGNPSIQELWWNAIWWSKMLMGGNVGGRKFRWEKIIQWISQHY